MALKMEKVSVIMPTYKRNEKFLKRAIDSLLAQTYENVEIVVIDDNAEFLEYRGIVKKLIDTYNGKVVLKQNEKNLGGALSRNEGINIAKGEYITFLDDDDRYLPEKIEKQLKYMKENDLEVCFADLKLFNSNEKMVDYREFSRIESFKNEDLLKYHLMYNITGTPTFMYKKEILEKIGGFYNSKVSQEYYLMFKTIQSGAKIGYFKSCGVVAYRHNEGSISFGKTKVEGELKLYDFKKQYFNLLDKKQQKYVTFRFYAIMAVVNIRNKTYFSAFKYMLLAVFSSPITTFREFFKYIKTIVKFEK